MNELGLGALCGTMFMAGLAGSLHCVGMCGPILVAFSGVVGNGDGLRGRLEFLAYHAGRLWTYGLLGLLAGWTGSELRVGSASLGWQRPLAVIFAVLVILSGLSAMGWLPGWRFMTSSSGCGQMIRQGRRGLGLLAGRQRLAARLLLGSVMGFLPCGLVYAMLLVVATLSSPLASAVAMLCFGLGTLPSLTAVVLGSRALPIRWRAQGTRIAAVLILGIGVFMLARALLVTSAHGHGMP